MSSEAPQWEKRSLYELADYVNGLRDQAIGVESTTEYRW